jgi:hypothetical protein
LRFLGGVKALLVEDAIEPVFHPAAHLDVAQVGVEAPVHEHRCIRVQPNGVPARCLRVVFADLDQESSNPTTLPVGMDRNVLQERDRGLVDEHEEPCDVDTDLRDPDKVASDRPCVVGVHRSGSLATHESDVRQV